MTRLTNMYYSKYESSIESEAAYDSDNSDTYKKLIESPSQVEFRQYIQHRNDEELLYEYWKLRIREEVNLAKEIKEKCNMEVDLADNRVRYVYKPAIGESYIPGIKFKIVFVYVKLLRKWFINLGYSRLPSIIKLENKIKRGTYDPVDPKILKMVYKIKNVLDIFVQRLGYIFKVIDNVKEDYKDMEFRINELLTNIKIILKEKAWPKGIEKTSPEDIIVLEIILNSNLETESLSYEYRCSKNVSAQKKKMCIIKLERKLNLFLDFPLMKALRTFMSEENFAFDEVSPSS